MKDFFDRSEIIPVLQGVDLRLTLTLYLHLKMTRQSGRIMA